MISGGIEVNLFVQIHLILEANLTTIPRSFFLAKIFPAKTLFQFTQGNWLSF